MEHQTGRIQSAPSRLAVYFKKGRIQSAPTINPQSFIIKLHHTIDFEYYTSYTSKIVSGKNGLPLLSEIYSPFFADNGNFYLSGIGHFFLDALAQVNG